MKTTPQPQDQPPEDLEAVAVRLAIADERAAVVLFLRAKIGRDTPLSDVARAVARGEHRRSRSAAAVCRGPEAGRACTRTGTGPGSWRRPERCDYPPSAATLLDEAR